jgi:predicted extracellular nuclease
VALVSDGTLLAGSGCPFAASVMDFVGYGPSADCFEGRGPAPAPSNTTAALRAFAGCTDSNDNAADFGTGPPDPRNSASPPQSCVPQELALHQIQGDGNSSPHDGALVATSGIVTGLKGNGFFLQTPDGAGDGDPDSSEAIFVFTSGAPPGAAAAGNEVHVVGLVQEFVPGPDPNSPPVTELTSPGVTLLSTGNALPAPITLSSADTDPAGSIEQLERLEGMRVHVAALSVVAPTGGSIDEVNASSTSDGIFYGVIPGLARPFREPGIEVPDPLPPGAPCCVPRFDANPERLRVDSDGQPGAAALEVTAGALVTGLTGPLDYSFRTYTILPDPPPADPPVASGNTSAVPVRDAAADEFTVASFNLERFFDTVDDPAISEPVLTPGAFDNRLNKTSLAVRNVLRFPDILGVEEAENLATLQTLAKRINDDAVLAGQPDPQYQAYLVEGNDIGGIDVGFLVKGSARVEVLSVTQEGKDETYIDPDTGLPALLNDRPPLVLEAEVQPPTGAAAPVTVIVNHLRSLNDIDDPADGNRVRHKRRAQAEYLAGLVQGRQAADPDERIVSVGDYNVFQFNDGYVDSMGTIKGTPTPPTDVVLASGDLVDPDLANLVELAPADQRYSFSFDGNAQVLDHVLATQNLLPHFRDFAYARNDTDFPESFRNDPTRPERISDHDVPVAYFSAISLSATAPAQVFVGLKNSDDLGAAFDVRAELLVNGVPVTQGESLCVTGLSRPPGAALELSVPFAPQPGAPLASGDVLELKLSTRIGTNPDGTQCAARGKAHGLRLYYDAPRRPSRFGAEITPDPLRDYFLRQVGGAFVLDPAAPVSPEPKQKDSGRLNFAGGNPWVEIGTWQRTIP